MMPARVELDAGPSFETGVATMEHFWRAAYGAAACLSIFIVLPPSAHADPSGVVIAVVQAAHVDGQTGKMILAQAAPVYSGDHITTDAAGLVQVKFRDDTKLVIGPNAMMVIDAFVFSDKYTARQISINAVRGAFRFITGNSPKDAYSIRTPTATIAVRG
jgi:hypothetical protein